MNLSYCLLQVNKILESIRPDRQTVMFSATFPKQMEALARRVLHKPIEVTVGSRSVVCKDVVQNIIILDDEQKFLKLLELLGIYQPLGSVIVFVDKQEHCDELMRNLLRHSYTCMSLHGGIDQDDRGSTLIDFKNGNMPLLIATSIAARGLDVKDLILVVNYDCPNHYEDYVHRCGRTGRAGKTGYAYTFLTPEQDRYAGALIEALRTAGAPVPQELVDLWDNYEKKMKAMGKQVKKFAGFGGHGYKFDKSETDLKDEQKKMQKVVMGLGDSDEDEESQDVCVLFFYLCMTNIYLFVFFSRLISKSIPCLKARSQSKRKVMRPSYRMLQRIQMTMALLRLAPMIQHRNWN